MGQATVVTSSQEERITPSSHFLEMMQNIFEKCAETPSRGAIGCCSNIPGLLERYTVQFKVTVDLQSAFRKMLCLRAALKNTMVNYISLES